MKYDEIIITAHLDFLEYIASLMAHRMVMRSSRKVTVF